MYQGSWAYFLHLIASVQKILKINENAGKNSMVGWFMLIVISTHGFPIRLLVQAALCVPLWPGVWYVWLADCLGGLACCRTGSRVGLLRAESQRRYKNCQMCHYHISWDYLWVAYEMLRQQHEAILIWHFKKTKCLFFGLSRELKLHFQNQI